MKKALMLAVMLTATANAGWADWQEPETVGELSGNGLYSVGMGSLMLVSSPLVLSADVAKDGVVVGTRHGWEQVTSGAGLSTIGLVYLLEGTGKGLSELTGNTLAASGALLQVTGEALAGVPSRKVKTSQGVKTIPLVVRDECVQLHDKIQE